MTTKTAASLKKLLALCRIAAGLCWGLAVEALLPEVCRYGLDLILRITVRLYAVPILASAKTPEGGHLGSGTKCLRILQPNWKPFLSQLEPNVFQIRPNLLLVLHQILRLQV